MSEQRLRSIEDRLIKIEDRLAYHETIVATKEDLQRELRVIDQRLADFAERMHRDLRTLQWGIGITVLGVVAGALYFAIPRS